MKILLSNDDGVNAQGIQVLYDVLSTIADVTVVAPMEEKSATGQTLTLEHPVRIEKIKDNFYGVNGFPADCSLMGIIHLLDQKPDLVVSGINRGANLGQDIYYSGTVAAARQAIFHHVPAIALSTVIDNDPHRSDNINYSTAAKFAKYFIEQNLHTYLKPMSMLNINVPDVDKCDLSGLEVTTLGFRRYKESVEKRIDNRSREYFWIGGSLEYSENLPGTDCYAIENKRISVNPLNLLSDSSDEVFRWTEIFKSTEGSFI